MKKERLKPTKKNDKSLLGFKIFLTIAAIIIVTLVCLYFIEMNNGEISYFSKHFSIFISLTLIGVIAIMLPRFASRNLAGSDRGDNMMIIVGMLLFICAIFALVMSYL